MFQLNGCTDFTLSETVLGLASWKMDPNNIVLIAEFTEAGTGIVQTAISRTVMVHEALKLEFENYTAKYFKFGLPYHGKVIFYPILIVFQCDFNPSAVTIVSFY